MAENNPRTLLSEESPSVQIHLGILQNVRSESNQSKLQIESLKYFSI
jgi:hypothetical protein